MADVHTPSAPALGKANPGDRLDSWKEIAAYLSRSTRTLRRWEQTQGLPVHRLAHEKRGSVYAYRSELDAWWESRRTLLDQEVEAETEKHGPGARRMVWVAGLISVLFVAGMALWLLRRTWISNKTPPGFQVTQLTFDTGWTSSPVLSRDGQLLVYASDRGFPGSSHIWVQRVNGGDPVQLSHHEAVDLTPDLSPDGNRVVFRSSRDGGGIYMAPVLGGEVRRIADRGYSPRFSPDSAWVAYAAWAPPPAEAAITIVSANGGEPRRLDGPAINAKCPLWTPDSKHVVFNAAGPKDYKYEWWVAPVRDPSRAYSTGVLEMLRRQGVAFVPALTCPEDWLEGDVVFSAWEGNSGQLWRVPISPANLKVAGPARRMALGPGVAFARVSGGTMVFAVQNRMAHVFAIPAGGDALTQLTRDQSLVGGLEGTRPQFSRDGTKLVLASKRSGNLDIWLTDLPSGQERALASSAVDEDQPTLSADGLRVAYVRREDGKPAIYVTETSVPLPKKVCDDCGAPRDWSPDGRRVLFIRDGSLFALEVATGRTQELFKRGRRSVKEAAFSPDGAWMALVTDTGEAVRRGYVARLTETLAPEDSWISITDERFDLSLHWSPDGNRVYYFSTRDGFRCLWSQALDARTRQPRGGPLEVHHFHRAQRYPVSGSWISVARDKIAVNLVETYSNVWKAEVSR